MLNSVSEIPELHSKAAATMDSTKHIVLQIIKECCEFSVVLVFRITVAICGL
jgi:hypothetical protein